MPPPSTSPSPGSPASPSSCLKNGGTLERAEQMANHASTRTTQLYDRRREELSLRAGGCGVRWKVQPSMVSSAGMHGTYLRAVVRGELRRNLDGSAAASSRPRD
jgi:hypothetical protein